MAVVPLPKKLSSYLPNRQLRNTETFGSVSRLGYLPNRQLRKAFLGNVLRFFCYLPNRQLRKRARRGRLIP